MTDLHLLRISCGGCAAIWAGADRAHCAACHETWESVELYDDHRRGGVCQRPQALGLTPTKNRIWQRRDGARPRVRVSRSRVQSKSG